MRRVKDLLRKLFPKLYHRLWRWKEGGELPRRFEPYYRGDSPTMKMDVPEPCLQQLQLPVYVDTILDVGCASGRNFIPFNGKLKLWGVDIVPFERIKWVQPFVDLTYENGGLENLTKRLEGEPVDLSRTLIFTAGTMAYCSEEWQKRFYAICQKRGAKNFIFLEYPPQERYPNKNFKLPQSEFTAKKFREPTKAVTFYRLDTNS